MRFTAPYDLFLYTMRSFLTALVLAAPAFSAIIIPRAAKDEYLQAHNDFRAQHGAAALTWNDNMAGSAQGWANQCVFEHSGGTLGPYGGMYCSL